MLIKSLIIFLALGLSLFSLEVSVTSQPAPLPRIQASKSRCCSCTGDLWLFGVEENSAQSALERQAVLKVNSVQPLLLYQVFSDKPEKIVLKITDARGKFDRTLIFQKELETSTSDYSALRLPILDPSKKYLMTIVLLCNGRTQNGSVINTWLSVVNEQTRVNEFVQNQNITIVQ